MTANPPAPRADYAPRPANNRSRMTNTGCLLPGVDLRTALARRYRDILGQLVSDQGGADRLSEARIQLCRRRRLRLYRRADGGQAGCW
jgi:hypothetical protein